MAKVEIHVGDTFTKGLSDNVVWQYRDGKCREITSTEVSHFRDEARTDWESDISASDAIKTMTGFGHEVVIVGEMPSPEVTRRDEERRDSVALEALKVLIATGYDEPAHAAACAYALADAMEAARKGGGR